MTEGVGTVGVYVRDQDEVVEFYVGKLGFEIHTDARNGSYRWLTVRHPNQAGFQLGLFRPGPPALDEATTRTVNEVVAKGRHAAASAGGRRLPRGTRAVLCRRRGIHPGADSRHARVKRRPALPQTRG